MARTLYIWDLVDSISCSGRILKFEPKFLWCSSFDGLLFCVRLNLGSVQGLGSFMRIVRSTECAVNLQEGNG